MSPGSKWLGPYLPPASGCDKQLLTNWYGQKVWLSQIRGYQLSYMGNLLWPAQESEFINGRRITIKRISDHKLPHIWREKMCAQDAICHSCMGKETYRKTFHQDSFSVQLEHPLQISFLLPTWPEHLVRSSEGIQPWMYPFYQGQRPRNRTTDQLHLLC